MWFKKDKKEFNEEDVIDVEVEENEDEIFDNNDYVEGEIKEDKKKASFDRSVFEEGLKDLEDAMGQLGDSIAKGFNKAKVWINDNFKNGKRNSITNKLIKILPFMDEEDIHEIVDKILSDDPDFKDVDVVAIMPFLEDEDCDKIFIKKIQEDDEIALELVNFVSEECLSLLVDAYIEGKYPNLNVDKLYPFLDGDDVKKLFYFELRKAKK